MLAPAAAVVEEVVEEVEVEFEKKVAAVAAASGVRVDPNDFWYPATLPKEVHRWSRPP